MAEKKDVENIYNYLQKLDGAQAPPSIQQPQPVAQPPQPSPTASSPLVLHVRET